VRQVRPIVEAVRARGDAAVGEFTARFDGVQLAQNVHRVTVRARACHPPRVRVTEPACCCAGAA